MKEKTPNESEDEEDVDFLEDAGEGEEEDAEEEDAEEEDDEEEDDDDGEGGEP
jgi:hypothetical protein